MHRRPRRPRRVRPAAGWTLKCALAGAVGYTAATLLNHVIPYVT